MSDEVACAGGMMSVSDMVRAWMAFRELRKRERIHVSFSGREYARARNAGWKLGFRVEKNYVARMCEHPWDFYRGFEWGVDLFLAGSDDPVHPDQLVRALLKEVGAATVDGHFLSPVVEQWVSRFREKQKEVMASKY